MLRNELDTMLQPVNGRVLDIIVIPDFQRLFDLETEKKELEELKNMVSARGEGYGCTGLVNRCCFGLFWTNCNMNANAVEERLKTLEQEIDKEIEKPYLTSGHAFVVLDSL